MSYAPDYVDLLLSLGIIVASGCILHQTVCRDSDWQECRLDQLWKRWICACLVAIVGFGAFLREAELVPKLCLLLLAVYLVVGSVMDKMLCAINNYVQYIGVIGGVIWLLYYFPEKEIGFSLLFFGFIQYCVFYRMYGGADVTAFLICALFLSGKNKNVEAYLIHMAICYLFLAVIQGTRGNIARSGNLKKPVALYPYISTSFLLIFYQ
ncbi:MAG: hypothetical protein IJX63_14520 [Lachnospiraceae bacterium]|nr:hypothetical protein [Lachnospiraceae bacterium]